MEKRTLKEMRLIDANQFEVISWRAQGGREYANGFDDGVDYVVQKIDNAETVKAIPIEWIEELLTEPDTKNHAECLLSLWKWYKEQEEEK